MTQKIRRFYSKEAYRKWTALGQMHGAFAKTPGVQKIIISGQLHKVKHSR